MKNFYKLTYLKQTAAEMKKNKTNGNNPKIEKHYIHYTRAKASSSSSSLSASYHRLVVVVEAKLTNANAVFLKSRIFLHCVYILCLVLSHDWDYIILWIRSSFVSLGIVVVVDMRLRASERSKARAAFICMHVENNKIYLERE